LERSDSDILPPIAPNPVFNTEKEIIFKTSDIFDKIDIFVDKIDIFFYLDL